MRAVITLSLLVGEGEDHRRSELRELAGGEERDQRHAPGSVAPVGERLPADRMGLIEHGRETAAQLRARKTRELARALEGPGRPDAVRHPSAVCRLSSELCDLS